MKLSIQALQQYIMLPEYVTTDNSLINAHTLFMRMRCNRHNRHVVFYIGDNRSDNTGDNTVNSRTNPTLQILLKLQLSLETCHKAIFQNLIH